MNHTPLLAAIAAAATFSAHAADSMRPGLWEITSNVTGGNGQAAAAMAEAKKQMAAMSPEQRQMMESMMAKHGAGMSMSGDGVKITHCVTREMAARREIPTAQQGKCTSTTTPTATGMTVSFTCANPPSSGNGTVTLQGDTGYTTTMQVTSSARGKPETMTVDASGRWLSADCGAKTPK